MNLFSTTAVLLLAAMFTFSAAAKFLRTASMTRHWREYRYPMPLMQGIAVLEAAVVVSMIASLWLPWIRLLGAGLCAVLMLGAVHAHLVRARHKPFMASNALLMLGLALYLLWTTAAA
ncbi:DoxX family protein [Paenibacillus caseinilyticus]|uniref:DoxX family protein n=1 Tax=Paenibacillus mucilaginosus K02 TaxID=997761 RepID=I0BLQ2_9BACL|nr:DoxX family protein [Paenibacillus mucilaginosus]AFH63299.1 doxX family protein [Paenibacillus mucilaginosus K02]